MGWEKWNELVLNENIFETSKKNARNSSITKPTHIVIHITGTDNFEAVKDRFLNQNASAHYLIKKDGTVVQFVRDRDRAWHSGILSHIRKLYDYEDGRWKKYLRYFPWYKGYPPNAKYLKKDLTPALTANERALVSKNDNSNWDEFNYWGQRHTTNIPINYNTDNDPNNYSIGIELLTTGGKEPNYYDDGLYNGLLKLLSNLCDKYNIPRDQDHIIGHEDVNPVERWGWDPNSGFDWDKVFAGLVKSNFFPLDLGSGTTVDKKSLNQYYSHTEREAQGGFFPVGANTVWHGGVHIRPKEGQAVYAIAPGTIVAARLPEKDPAPLKNYGSRNFVVVKHQTEKEKTWYSLYMHLKSIPLKPGNGKIIQVPWLKNGLKENEENQKLQFDKEALEKGKVIKLEIPIHAGDVIGLAGKFGSVDYRIPLLHWEIFSEELIGEGWDKVEDLDEDFTCDAETIKKMVDKDKFWGKGELSQKEILNFYHSEEQTPKMRDFACKFISEWAVDWDKTISSWKDRFSTSSLAERIKEYNFWDEALAAGCDLPKSKIVWHYNPVRFLEKLMPATAENKKNLVANSSEASNLPYKKGHYDDEAVKKYKSRKPGHSNHKKGNNIYKIQQDLSSFGFTEVGTPDGDFGGKTEAAVKTFQTAALGKKRKKDEKEIEVDVTYEGESTGEVDSDTYAEIELWKEKGYVRTNAGGSETTTPNPGINIDWAFISKMEGNEKDIYVPLKKDGSVDGQSGPTIASGFDIGQINEAELKRYNFPDKLFKELVKYVNKKGNIAKKYVEENPLTLSDSDIALINKKVKAKYAKEAEDFYNEVITEDNKKFKYLHSAIQTSFTSVYFQYRVARDPRAKLKKGDIKGAIYTFLHFTTKTHKVKNKSKGTEINIMQYMERRCQEARYMLKAIDDDAVKSEALKMIEAREKEWENAHGRKKWW